MTPEDEKMLLASVRLLSDELFKAKEEIVQLQTRQVQTENQMAIMGTAMEIDGVL